jgi:membrane-bound inhibitor of C-type lysozyme
MRRFLILIVAASTLSACQRENLQVVGYRCGELTVSAIFRGQERATIAIGDRKLELGLVPAASGAKYADSAGNEFWTKGPDEAMLTLSGEATRNCRSTSS